MLDGKFKELQDTMVAQVKKPTNKKFKSERLLDQPSFKITNLENGKEAIVPIYAAAEVIVALDKLL